MAGVRVDRSSPGVDLAAVAPQPDVQAEPQAPQGGDDLDALLAEFEQGTTRPAEPQLEISDAEPQLRTERAQFYRQQSDFNSEVQNYTQQRLQEKHEADFTSLIKEVRGELDPELFTDKMIRAFIDAEARENEHLQDAWLNRAANPARFRRAASELVKQFASHAKRMPDPQLTQDRELVSQYVRTATGQAPTDRQPNLGRMTNDEFRKYAIDTYGINPSV